MCFPKNGENLLDVVQARSDFQKGNEDDRRCIWDLSGEEVVGLSTQAAEKAWENLGSDGLREVGSFVCCGLRSKEEAEGGTEGWSDC